MAQLDTSDGRAVPDRMMNAFAETVHAYVAPGEPVLLLSSPGSPDDRHAVRGWTSWAGLESASGPMLGLMEVGGAAARLGRIIQAGVVGPANPHPRIGADRAQTVSESAFGLYGSVYESALPSLIESAASNTVWSIAEPAARSGVAQDVLAYALSGDCHDLCGRVSRAEPA